MNKCENCNIYIYDNTEICPLCHSVVSDLNDEESKRITDIYGKPAPYPDIMEKTRKINFVMKLLLLLFILGEVAAIIINLKTNPKFLWCILSFVGLTYIYSTMKYWLEHDSGFSSKVGLQIFLSIIIIYCINLYTGKPYWSLEWAIPGMVILGDISVFIFILIYRESWYSYILLLLMMVLCSIGLWVFFFMGYIGNIILLIICSSLSCLFLLVLAIFKDKEVKRELKRRFHI
ncbi:MAG: hypothetical protein K6G11_06885 [Lachnospiraceae bacterium]|nr:hypothetical protein [Lachnospiraceae bacterium]